MLVPVETRLVIARAPVASSRTRSSAERRGTPLRADSGCEPPALDAAASKSAVRASRRSL
jgi:hypothetical protein